MKSDPTLRRWYTDFRKRYFGASVPPASEVDMHYVANPRVGHYPSTAYVMHDDCGYAIAIDANLKGYDRIVRLALLHEMAHISCGDKRYGHGAKWKAEGERLWQLGAIKNLW